MSRPDPPMTADGAAAELARLRAENDELRRVQRDMFGYIRDKTNHLLNVIGTRSLRPEELEDWSLLDLDPIGIVTESFQQVLENLRETNARLQLAHQEVQAVFEAAGAAVLVLDPQLRIVAYNKRVRDLLLKSDGDVTGVICQDVICRTKESLRNCAHRKVLASGRPEATVGFEANGRVFDVIGQPIKDALGRVTHVVLAYSDVTEHLRNQSELSAALDEIRRGKQQIDTLLRSMSDGLVATDSQGQIVLMNRTAEQLLGIDLEESRGLSQFEVIQHPGLREHLESVAHGDSDMISDIDFVDADGITQIFQARTSAQTCAGSSEKGHITLMHNVTRTREVERIKDEFLSTAAHQLRTPLASVIGYADLLMASDNIGRDTRHEYLSLIHSKAEQLSEIVSNLLDISRIEAGEGVTLSRRPHAVSGLCAEAIDTVSPGHDAHQFVMPTSTAELQVMADRFAVLQVLENLLSNAVKYSPQGGRIALSAQTVDGGMCDIAVSDEGIGMTAEQAGHAFDKFYRADASNTAIAGTGLGLTIVRHLVDAHGGRVWIDSRPGAGTTVHCTFPLAGQR